jgi:flagella basal body P-ring formation protein FlgA
MRCLLVLLILMQFSPTQVWAEAIHGPKSLKGAASRYLQEQIATSYPDSTAEVSIGPVNDRLSSTECTSASFFVTAGSHLWGSGMLGMQCDAPTSWNMYLSYRIRLRGPALVALRPLASNYAPNAQDLAKREIEYQTDPGRYPRDPDNLHDATLTMPIAKGTPLTIDILRVPPIIQAGQEVRIIANGPGFQISQVGIAQQQAGIGDLLRIKLSSGRYIQGTVQEDGTVYIKP